MNGLHAVRAFAVLVLASLLSGCAALTVSVDVYKGPLANDEHVLTEQTAVMAIGAKPLLKQLRCEVLQAAVKKDAAQTDRDPECEVDLDTVTWKGKERAKRVEAVSTLYEDQLESVPEFSRFFSFAHVKQEEFETALKTLQGDRKEEATWWKGIKPLSGRKFRQVLDSVFPEFKGKSAKEQGDVKNAREKLIAAANEVMVIPEDGYRRVRDLLYAFVQLDWLLKRPGYKPGRQPVMSMYNRIPPRIFPVDLRTPYDGQTTPGYALLAQEEVRQQLTRMMFGGEESKRTERYQKHLASMASSFLATRQAIRELWTESIGFLRFLNDPAGNEENRLWTEQWIEEIEAARPGLTLAVARLIAALTDVQDIAVMICLLDTEWTDAGKCSPGNSHVTSDKQDTISTLRRYLVEQSEAQIWTICLDKENCNLKADWDRARLREARRALELAIIARPEEMTVLLLESDRIFQGIPYAEFEKLPANKDSSGTDIDPKVIGYAAYQQKTGYKQGDYRWEYYCGENLGKWVRAACQKTQSFGITEVRRRDLKLQETLQRNIAVVEKAGGVGLGRGRLLQGLDTLIEEYIEAAADAKPDAEDIKIKRGRLLNALVRFAEKVLVIANHQELLDPSENDSSENNDVNKYVVTLQAIGNAIIVQVDDLIRRQSHRSHLERRALAEIEALRRAAVPDAEEALNRVRQDLMAKHNAATKALAGKLAEKLEAAEELKAGEKRVQKLQGEATEPAKGKAEDSEAEKAPGQESNDEATESTEGDAKDSVAEKAPGQESNDEVIEPAKGNAKDSVPEVAPGQESNDEATEPVKGNAKDSVAEVAPGQESNDEATEPANGKAEDSEAEKAPGQESNDEVIEPAKGNAKDSVAEVAPGQESNDEATESTEGNAKDSVAEKAPGQKSNDEATEPANGNAKDSVAEVAPGQESNDEVIEPAKGKTEDSEAEVAPGQESNDEVIEPAKGKAEGSEAEKAPGQESNDEPTESAEGKTKDSEAEKAPGQESNDEPTETTEGKTKDSEAEKAPGQESNDEPTETAKGKAKDSESDQAPGQESNDEPTETAKGKAKDSESDQAPGQESNDEPTETAKGKAKDSESDQAPGQESNDEPTETAKGKAKDSESDQAPGQESNDEPTETAKGKAEKLKAAAELDAAKERVQKLQAEVAELEEQVEATTEVMEVTESFIDNTLQPLIQAETLHEGAEAFALLQAELTRRARSARSELISRSGSEKEAGAEGEYRLAENALKVFGELSAPLKGIPGFQGQAAEDKPPLSQLDVLDSMIAHLRYEHIRAEQEGRLDKAKQIQQALDSAYEQRAGMAFIRPSAAFLRSSYAGTGLQDDPGLAWRNMLLEHSRRARGGKEVEGTTRVIAETDKQFWQNINKVRVDGGGRTNYVLAKDDVGNWYVKSYSTDRTAIFQSARNLALFGAGAALDLNLLERMTLEQEFQEKGSALDPDKKQRLNELRAEQPKAGTPTALRGVFDRYRAQYNDMTAKAHAKLLKQLAPPSENSAAKGTELGARIQAAWEAHSPLQGDHLERLGKARLALSEAMMGERYREMAALDAGQGEDGQPLSPDAKAQRQAAQVIHALRSVADFEAALVAAIERNGALPASLAAAAKAAAQGQYDKARQDHEELQNDLDDMKAEFENKRAAVSSLEGDEIQDQRQAALDELNAEESEKRAALENEIKAAETAEEERKTTLHEAVKDLDAVRQAQQVAKATVAAIAGVLFRDVLEDRRQTVREYETAITYVGDLPSN